MGSGLPTADGVVRIALQTLDQVRGRDYEDLPPGVREAIEEAEAQYARGEGVPLDEAFDQLRKKHLGQ